jgi:hypothetical protein
VEVEKLVDETISFLCTVVSDLQFEDFTAILANDILSQFHCSILNLSSDVTTCLATTIQVISDPKTRITLSLFSQLISIGVINSIRNNGGIKSAISAVEISQKVYYSSVTQLTLLLSAQNLLNDRRHRMMEWIIQGTEWEDMHMKYINRRIPSTGEWFIRSDEVQNWVHGDLPILICHGAGNPSSKPYIN